MPVNLDCWLALAQNHISPKAYKQNDVVTALNGTTIEIIHTDAEGRMVLADTLTLASRAETRPDDRLRHPHRQHGHRAGCALQRHFLQPRKSARCRRWQQAKHPVNASCAFPLDADYEEALDSQIADIKQCTMEGEADHILAARFLMRFIENDPAWLHVDLSASNCKGGLGAVASDVNGFGVGWGMALLSGSAP